MTKLLGQQIERALSRARPYYYSNLMGDHPPETRRQIAADRRVLAEAREVAERMDKMLSLGTWDECPWCDGYESVNDDAELVFGFHDFDGCDLADLLASLRRETPS